MVLEEAQRAAKALTEVNKPKEKAREDRWRNLS